MPITREEEAYLCALKRLDPKIHWEEAADCMGRTTLEVKDLWSKLVAMDAMVTEIAQIVRGRMMVKHEPANDGSDSQWWAQHGVSNEIKRQRASPSDPPDSPVTKKSPGTSSNK